MEFAKKGEKEVTLSTLSLCKVAKSLIVNELVGTLRVCIAKRALQSCNDPHSTRFSRACLHFACVWEKGRGTAQYFSILKNDMDSTNGKNRQRQSASVSVRVDNFETFNIDH